ncbi:MAG TPA: isocitrate lyase/PEP mutase family protein [Caulobacteraceae bacterium]
MSSPVIADKLSRKEFFIAPGVQDMIAALIVDKVGFDVVYASGYWLTASALGLPDAGLATYSQMLERMTTLTATSKAAVIGDADTGYGGLLNVRHTVRGYEAAGVTAIQIEDQVFPKRCGHSPGTRTIPTADMVRKIEVAKDAILDKASTLIIARTDARASEGLEGCLRRAEAYAAAGADVLFPEALRDEEEMRAVCAAASIPVMANMANGGKTPILSAATLAEIGFAFAIFPSLTSLTAAKAMENALARLKRDGRGDAGETPLFDFAEFCRLVGLEETWDFERQWSM